MKYILLDTNIVIDMVIDRRHQVTDEILSSFVKLLDYNEIKLIVPEIVKLETYRHLENELLLVGKQIKEVMNSIDDLYGVATYKINGLDIQEYKSHSRRELAKAYEMYERNKTQYRADLERTIDMVFSHKNSIYIPCDDYLVNAVTKRRIYKRAPFHLEKKESYGDGLIVETLINLGRYVELKESDEIYFVTGNYTDFCVGKTEKETLLQDIIEDIVVAGVPCQIKCINTFGKLIGCVLKENIKRACLTEEFEKGFQALYDEEIKMREIEIHNMERESANLASLNDYEEKMEEELIGSKFAVEIEKKFEEINKLYRAFEEYGILYEELSNKLRYLSISDMPEVLEKLKRIFDRFWELPDIGVGEFTSEDIVEVLEWLENQIKLMDSIAELECLPDCICYGDKIDIENCEFETLKFEIDDLKLTPEERGSEVIDIRLRGEDGRTISCGCVSVTYGCIEFDENGCVGEGSKDGVSYEYEDIIEGLSDVVNGWKELWQEQEKIAEALRIEFGTF